MTASAVPSSGATAAAASTAVESGGMADTECGGGLLVVRWLILGGNLGFGLELGFELVEWKQTGENKADEYAICVSLSFPADGEIGGIQ